jgi:hypothetical protein
MSQQPVCGPFPAVAGPALGRTVEWVVTAIGFAGGVVTVAVQLGRLQGIIEGITGWIAGAAGGAAGTIVPASGAIVGAFIAVAIVLSQVMDRISPKPGQTRCYSGIVNEISRAFSSPVDFIVPYNAQHDRVDVVVKQTYWDFINATPARYAYCANDQRRSALIRSYFFSDRVQGAATGSAVGVAVGGMAGVVAGLLSGLAAGAALGGAACSLSLWFYLLCLAIVVLVALIVALVIALVSASVGGAVGAAASGGTGPTAPGPGGGPDVAIAVGHYITLNAVLAINGEDNDAWVGWWVNVTTAPAALHGTSSSGEGSGGGSPFNYDDADNGFQDACPVP